MKTIHQKIVLPGLAMLLLFVIGCDKNKPYPTTIPEPEVHFVGPSSILYAINDANPPAQNVTIGTTDVESKDREVSYTVTSTTGAVMGDDYTLSPTGKVVIPAGKATATISVQAKAANYPAGKTDTLIFTLNEPSVKVAGFLNKVQLVISGPCSDADVDDLNVMAGTYANTTDADGKYSVTISNISTTSATTGTGTITNLWGDIAPVTINFDWTDPENVRVTIPMQYMGYDYDAGMPMNIRTSPGKVSRFSVCSRTLTLYVDFLVMNYGGPGTAAYYEKEFLINVAK